MNGRPLFLFNIPNAKFILFGKIFWPQDFFIFGITMITFVFFIILFTAAFGRLFCGWACPQTNFMEMMFRKVEYLVLGDAPAQRQLKDAPWHLDKITKVAIKHILFYGLSFIIANFFLAYIIGIDELLTRLTSTLNEPYPSKSPVSSASLISRIPTLTSKLINDLLITSNKFFCISPPPGNVILLPSLFFHHLLISTITFSEHPECEEN